VSDQPRGPMPPVGHVENGWQWTGSQWVPFQPQGPVAPPGPIGPQAGPFAPQRPLVPPGQQGPHGATFIPQPATPSSPGPLPDAPFAPHRPGTQPDAPTYVTPATGTVKLKKPLWKRWWVWGIAVVVLLAAMSRLGGGSPTTQVAAPVVATSADPSAAAASAAAAAAKSSAAAAKASAAASSASAAAASASAAQASASAAAAAKAAASQAAEAARVNPANYAPISDRNWSIVQRDPDAHAGEKYVVYGCVTQFDANTGAGTFRANTGGAQQKSCWSYSVNTIVVAGSGTDVSKVAEEDLVKMYVEVVKAYTYTTTLGGSTTVPLVQVNIIQTVG
jgi:hypothetical protein